MPFDSSGQYTPPPGATTAVPGQLIQSAVWNSIFTDISAALNLLGIQLYNSSIISSTPYIPTTNDFFLLVNAAGPATINLPASASRAPRPITIKDASGNAHTNFITINPTGPESIDGQSSYTISVDYGGVNLFPVLNGWVVRP